MHEIAIGCTIEGQYHSPAQLARVQHARHLHVLHEMKRLGARMVHDGTSLSHDDIDVLGAEDAHRVSTAVRQSFSVDDITDLYQEQIRASDHMWKQANNAPIGAPLRASLADVTVTGITIDEFRDHAADPDLLERTYAQLNPDHYFCCQSDAGMHGMETFGMYGGPTEVYITTDPTISAPIVVEPDYSLLTAGYTRLASDGTDVNILALHQIKSLPDGFAVKLGAFFPPHTPNEVVDGHRVHMAIELWEMCKLLTHPLP
jgi:hypothetical protein